MIGSVRSALLLAVSSMAILSPAAADASRMRRPRGDRPDDAPRERGDRRGRGERPADPPRMRDSDGMYGEIAGAYGDMEMEMDMDTDMDMECTTTLLDAVAATPDLSTLGAAVAVRPLPFSPACISQFLQLLQLLQ